MLHMIKFEVYKDENRPEPMATEYFELSKERWEAVKALVETIE
jgi:hypothetical protein